MGNNRDDGFGGRHMRWGKPVERKKAPELQPASDVRHLILSVPGIQRRAWQAATNERNKPIGVDRGRITGLIPYNSLSADLNGFRELLAPGCFRKCLASGDDIAVLWQNNVERILGRRSAGTARFVEDAAALHFEADLADTSFAQDLKKLILRGDICESSAAFYVTKHRWEQSSGERVRIIEEAVLVAAGPVVFSMFSDSVVDVEQKIEAARAEGFQRGLAARGVQ
jgi:HK97 family phage prohead protease